MIVTLTCGYKSSTFSRSFRNKHAANLYNEDGVTLSTDCWSGKEAKK